jgi:hypothetical protein
MWDGNKFSAYNTFCIQKPTILRSMELQIKQNMFIINLFFFWIYHFAIAKEPHHSKDNVCFEEHFDMALCLQYT